MKLPELSASAAPEFSDAATCKAWLENVPLANVAAAQGELLYQLREFNRFPTAAAPRLAVMESLREAVNFVQIEQAKRFTNRALPMAQAEAEIFETTVSLWEQMQLGYARCLDAALNGDAGTRSQGALICQRVLAYNGLKMFHHYRAYRQVPGIEWRALHEAYAYAEKLRVADTAVKDLMNRDVHDSSPRIAYARAILVGMANPNELGQRPLTFVDVEISLPAIFDALCDFGELHARRPRRLRQGRVDGVDDIGLFSVALEEAGLGRPLPLILITVSRPALPDAVQQ